MTGGDYDAAVGLAERYGKLCRGGAGEAAAYHIHAAGNQSTDYKLLDHLAAEAGIASHDHLVTVAEGLLALLQAFAVCISELDYVNGGEVVTGRTSDRTTDSGNRFNQCHKLM